MRVTNKGLTLVEVMISMALFSLILLIFAALFLFSVNLIGMASRKKTGIMDASSKAELYKAGISGDVSTASNRFQINFGTVQVNVPGEYITADDANRQVSYKIFIPDDIQ